MQVFRDRRVIIFAHIGGWVLFMLFLFANEPETLSRLFKPPFFIWVMTFVLIAYFYFNSHVIVPRYLYEKRVWTFVGVTLLLMFLICIVIPYLMHVLFMPFQPPPGAMEIHSDFHNEKDAIFLKDRMRQLGFFRQLTLCLIVFIISTGIKVISEWYKEKQRLQEMEHLKVSAELTSLKSQIHPHFLFNSLNSIYYLAISKDDMAAESIMRLSNFLRFVTTESDKEYIPLEKEINTLGEYLELQKLRISDKLQLNFEVKGNTEFRKIIPLVFLPFVENAFKYGVSAHVESFIDIRIEIEKGMLEFHISNAILPMQKGISKSGIGLDNIRKRLNLAYPDRYTLDINEDDTIFAVYLKIKL